jgi:hypothetical protein
MNEKKNHHYISCVEQRLNACNPNAETDNQRIYEFRIRDRDARTISLTRLDGRLIKSNLSMFDLFSFDVKDRKTRDNFEASFERYETRLMLLTEQIHRAHASRSDRIEALLADILVTKFVNFIRNPYCVPKMLNTFGMLGKYHPTDQAIYARYERTLVGRRPQQTYLCRKLGISDQEYGTWLRVLFMLLTPWDAGNSNVFEQTIRGLLKQDTSVAMVQIHKFENERCLLSDRGFSSPAEDGKSLALDFNLCASVFIRFVFLSFETLSSPAVVEYARQCATNGTLLPWVSYLTDDLAALELFHRRVIEQAYEKVYCAATHIYGVRVGTDTAA